MTAHTAPAIETRPKARKLPTLSSIIPDTHVAKIIPAAIGASILATDPPSFWVGWLREGEGLGRC